MGELKESHKKEVAELKESHKKEVEKIKSEVPNPYHFYSVKLIAFSSLPLGSPRRGRERWRWTRTSRLNNYKPQSAETRSGRDQDRAGSLDPNVVLSSFSSLGMSPSLTLSPASGPVKESLSAQPVGIYF